MPLLDCRFLTSYREQRLAHLVLAAITMGFVWQEGEAQPQKVRGKERPISTAGLPARGIKTSAPGSVAQFPKSQWKVRKEG